MNNRTRKNLMLISIISFCILVLGGTSFALLRSATVGQNNYVINVGDVEVTFQGATNSLNVDKMYPMTDEEGITQEKELVFTVKNTGSVKSYFNVSIEETSTNPEFKSVIKYIVKKDTGEYNQPVLLSDNKYIDYNASLDPDGEYTYHVKVYLAEETEDEIYMNQTFKAKIHIESSQESYIKTFSLLDTIKDKLDESNSTNDGDTTYLSGDNETINFNYVWYSGKLWRITAINKDNTIKMITQDAITAIWWGADATYKGSWIYQWLNEDFLDTLENQENIIVQDSKWYATADNSSTLAKPTGATIDGKVGLLNAYEYYQSYKNASESTNYLNIGYYWWLITPYDSSYYVRYVNFTGNLGYESPSSNAYGVRPSVNLKSNIKISGGEGSKDEPYKIEGDKEVAQVDDKLNSRVSGEYVNFDGKKYRIVGIENDTTKLTSVDYVRSGSSVMGKYFSSGTTNYGSVGTSTSYWAGYLNDKSTSGWYGSISAEYKNMLVEGTYYLGQYGGNLTVSYKNTICSVSNTTETTKECSKTSSKWGGFVGLPRVGEMFSAMLGNGSTDTTTDIWLITPYSSSYVSGIGFTGDLFNDSPSSKLYSVRPSVNLNSNVVITEGEGTEQKPYDIKCDSCNGNS